MAQKHSGFKLLGNIDGDSNTYKCENMLDPTNAQDYMTKAYGEANFFDASSEVDHDATTNFVANEHIDWTNTTSNISTTGTITGVNVTSGADPGHTHTTPNTNAIIKGWCSFNGTGVIAIKSSYNVSGITDNGTGDYTVSWDTDFADTNYCVVANSNGRETQLGTKAAGSIQILTRGSSGGAIDTSEISVIAIGSQ